MHYICLNGYSACGKFTVRHQKKTNGILKKRRFSLLLLLLKYTVQWAVSFEIRCNQFRWNISHIHICKLVLAGDLFYKQFLLNLTLVLVRARIRMRSLASPQFLLFNIYIYVFYAYCTLCDCTWAKIYCNT